MALRVADTLAAAIAAIEKHGWCQGETWNDARQMCMFGSVTFALTGKTGVGLAGMLTGDQNAVHQAAADALSDATGGEGVEWNDAPERTVGEVLELMRRVEAEQRAAAS